MKGCVQEPCRETVQSNILNPAAQRCSGMLWSLFSLLGEKPSYASPGGRVQEAGKHCYSFFFFPLSSCELFMEVYSVLGKGFPVHYLLISSEALYFFLFFSFLFFFLGSL